MRSTGLFFPADRTWRSANAVVPHNSAQARATVPPYRYSVYGVSLLSSIPLSLPKLLASGFLEIELRMASTSFFRETLGDAQLQQIGRCSYQYVHLDDGSSYVRWDGIGEFLVSGNGCLITCRKLPRASMESFQVYLLGQALSFGLVKNGFEPVHATCVVIDGEAIAFLGNSGAGKSSLAAYFLRSGDQLLTDDLLLVRRTMDGLQAYPGPPRIKLLPRMARRFLGDSRGGSPMNPQTCKMVIPLAGEHICAAPVPLRAFYALAHPPRGIKKPDVRLRPLSSKEAFVTLLSHTFNYVILDGDRLQRQFAETARLTRDVPQSELSYPRRVGFLPAVRDAVLADLAKQRSEVSACAD